MSVSRLSFYDVIDEFQSLDHPYKVIEALAKNDKRLCIKLLTQLEQADFPIMRILSTLLYFLKSVVKIKSDLNATRLSLGDALRKNAIPYPAQENIKNALKNMDSQRLTNFIFAYSEIEKKCRQTKGNSYDVVFTDLLSIILPS
jgi:DNA polymerase III delta subunit